MPEARLGRQVEWDGREWDMRDEFVVVNNVAIGYHAWAEGDLSIEAEGKALKLLMAYLTPHQKMTMSRHGFMYERGGDDWYALHDGFSLMMLDRTGGFRSWRGIAINGYPRGDRLLAQLLMLRAQPELLAFACGMGGWPATGLIYHYIAERTYFPGP